MVIKQGTDAVEVDVATFSSPEAVDRWVKALQVAKRTIWPPEKKEKK